MAVGRDGTTYSSDQKRGGVGVLEEMQTNDFEQGGNLMLTMDAPEHTRYRKLVNRGFTPRQIGALEDRDEVACAVQLIGSGEPCRA